MKKFATIAIAALATVFAACSCQKAADDKTVSYIYSVSFNSGSYDDIYSCYNVKVKVSVPGCSDETMSVSKGFTFSKTTTTKGTVVAEVSAEPKSSMDDNTTYNIYLEMSLGAAEVGSVNVSGETMFSRLKYTGAELKALGTLTNKNAKAVK